MRQPESISYPAKACCFGKGHFYVVYGIIWAWIFFPFSGFSQVKYDWKPLPDVKAIKSYSDQFHAQVKKHPPDPAPPVIREVYLDEQPEFVTSIQPDLLSRLHFEAYELTLDQRIDIPNGMVFKDISNSNIKYLDQAHGLLTNDISVIAEDKDGLIYLGSSKGLLVFNGKELSVYQGNAAFSLTGIRSLWFDAEGKLWVATDINICYIQNQKIFVPEMDFGPTHLQGFSESSATGEFFIFTVYHGLFILKEGQMYQYNAGLPTPHVSCAIRTDDGRLWLAFGNSGFGYIQKDSLFMYKREGIENSPRSLLEVGGELWLGQFRGKLMKHRNDSLFNVLLNDRRRHHIYSFASNEQGLWFPDYAEGVYLIKKNGEYDFIGEEHGLNGRVSFTLMADSFENIWVADAGNGISRIDELAFRPTRKFVSNHGIFQIEPDAYGNSWYFMNGGGLISESEEGYVEYLNSDRYSTSGAVSGDSLWISSETLGLTVLKDGVFTTYRMKKDEELDSTIYDIKMDANGRIWGWNYANRLYSFRNGQFYNFSSAPDLNDFKFINVLQTADKTIYAVALNNGVIAISNNKYAHLNMGNGLLSDQISFVFQDESGNTWFCASGRVQVVDAQGQSTVYQIKETESNPILQILETEKGSFMATTASGLLLMEKDQEGLTHKFYGKENGLKLIGNRMITRDRQGRILIGGGTSLKTFDPYYLKSDKSRPRLTLNRVLADGVEVDRDHLEVEQEKVVNFVFNKIFWGQQSDLVYKLQHRSRSGNWNHVSSNVISFKELQYGNYELLVYAEGEGRKSEELQFKFTILPFWYQTDGAKLMYFLLAVTLIVGYIFYRESRARIAKIRLQKLVDERTAELQVEKLNVVRQLQQKEILMQEVHHRVKNNLTFLKSLLYLRARASKDAEVRLILDECQARIQSMALVHQNLYDVQDASEVDFDLFLRELFFELESMFDQDRSNINIELAVSDFKVDVKLSVFLGLILNEMITNSFKYAFPNGEEGRILVRLSQMSEHFELTYADSGLGFGESFDFKTSTGFGFKLINILLNQIDAQMQYVNNGMTTFTIVIPK